MKRSEKESRWMNETFFGCFFCHASFSTEKLWLKNLGGEKEKMNERRRTNNVDEKNATQQTLAKFELKSFAVAGIIAIALIAIIVMPASATTWYVDDNKGTHPDFTSIQDAVTAASDGDTIIVRDGYYQENIGVGKGLAIISANGPAVTIVAAADACQHVFTVSTSNVEISGFTLKGANVCTEKAGIRLQRDISSCTISNNIITDNKFGIYIDRCGNNVITRNTIEGNAGYGVWVYYPRGGNNEFYANNFINGVSWSNHALPPWNSQSEIAYAYNDNIYVNFMGDYWPGYTGVDSDNDGIGDTPYVLSGEYGHTAPDNYPLMEPFENYPEAQPPDLIPTAIAAPPLFVDMTSTITATIDNVGGADAGPFNVSLSADESIVDTVSVQSLNVSESTNVSFSWTPASAGDYELCVVADTDDAIDEPDETNNRACTVVTVSEVSAEIVWQHGALVPWDAERLSDGNTLITEYGNHTVIEVTPAGTIVWQYGTGTQGSGPGELNCPHDAKRLTGGNTLITDYNNHRVIEVNLSGAIVWQYGTDTAGSGTDQLDYPTDAERLSGGNTLIADRLNNRVIEVDSTGTIVWEMTWLYHPFDVDRLPDGNTLIADYRNHRVIEVNPSREIIWQYGTGIPDEYGSGVNELNFPTDAERLSNGDTLIVDAMNDRVIAVRTSDYDPVRANNGFITRSIVWEYESNYPADAERLSNGNTLIAEAGNNRVIEVLTPTAELKPVTPFMLFGEVEYDTGEPVQNLTVTVKNVDTTEEFDVDIYVSESCSFYQVLTVSGHVLAGDVLLFTASNDNTTEFSYTVTDADMNHGGFVQNITIVHPPVLKPDLTVTAINAYHYSTYASPWFNLSNEVDVTIENTGTTPANESDVSLYIDGEFFDRLPVPSMAAGASETVTFTGWMPVGEDCLQEPCVFEWSSEEYSFTAVADCGNDVDELDETNNETTVVDMACYNGYTADEPLENAAHGMLHGGLLFTTGDGQYGGLYSVGSYRDTHYDIELPAGASVELAHLNVYYTWNKPLGTCPEMEVNITTPGGTTYTALPRMKAYNDLKCECAGSPWVLPWGNYVYDLTDYITENGTYTVRVRNVCTACQNFCPAAPGIVLVYENANAPMIEYWINEGADKLIGGRRGDGGSLSLEECINNAAFPGSIDLSTVTNATLGVVSPWGDEMPDDVLYFNEIELGRGVYHGYGSPYSATINNVSMEIGAGNAQVGLNVSDVTDQLSDSNNVAGQGDDGDCMMPANAFLVVEYGGVETIPAGVTLSPKKIDLNSSGVLKAYITLPEGYDVANISVSTVECEGAPVFGFGKVIPGKNELEVKFKIQNLTVPTGPEVLLTVTGELYDGTRFEGSNTVEVV